MKCMIAYSPSNSTFLAGSRGLVSLTFDAEIHDMISADGTVVNHNIPSPESNGIPLFDLEFLLFTFGLDFFSCSF